LTLPPFQTGAQVEQQYFQIGAFVSPVTAATTNELLQDADPALWAVLSFLQGVLQIHLGARWDAEMTRVGLTQYVGRCSANAVPYDPLPFLTQAQFQLPCLAVFAHEEKPSERTRQLIHSEETWKALWILPALRPSHYRAVYPFLRAAGKVLLDRIELGYDPSYKSGSLVCVDGGIEMIEVTKMSYGSIPKLNEEMLFPTIEVDLQVDEIKALAPSPPATRNLMTGTDGTISIVDQTGSETFLNTQDDL